MNEDRYSIVGINEFKIGIQLKYLQEIFTLGRITPIPNSPAYFKGVINLRGNIIALIDIMKLVVGEMTKAESESNVLILNNGSYSVGIQVSGMYSIVAIPENKIATVESGETLSRFCSQKYSDISLGTVYILNVKKMMNSPELTIYF